MTLRCNLFHTLPRGSTKYIAIRDTLTSNKEEFDAYLIDTIHCRQGRLGIGYHFLILTKGDIQLCRHPEATGSHSRNLDEISVAVGLIGGVTNGVRENNRTPEQLEALDDLIGVLRERYPTAEIDDRPQS